MRGFTLIECALVVTVLGLTTLGTLHVVQIAKDARGGEATSHNLDRAQAALQLYVMRHACLPCPADGKLPSTDPNAGSAMDDTGSPVATCSTSCLRADGVLPWRVLGLSEADASDAWGTRLRYAVSGPTAQSCVAGARAPGPLSGAGSMARDRHCFPVGALTVYRTDGGPTPEQTQAAYVVLSHGPDRSMGYAATTGSKRGDRYAQAGSGQGQDINAHSPDAFAYGPLNAQDGPDHFDDMVRFTMAPIIITRCGAKTCGNP